MEPPWGLQWPQGCCGQDPTTAWLKSQLLFSRKTSPLRGQAPVFSVCTQGRDLELGVCSSSCKDTSPAESGLPSRLHSSISKYSLMGDGTPMMKLGDMVQPTTLGHWAGAYGVCSHALLSWRGVLVGGSWAPSPLPGQVPSPVLPAQSSHTRGCSLPSPAPQLQRRWPWRCLVLGEEGGTGGGFPPAAGDPDCVHPQQDCSSGLQSQ